MVELILKLLASGLSIWDHKEKNKYVEEKMNLEQLWREEKAKPREHQSDARLDNIEFRIRLLAESFAGAIANSTK